MKTAKQFTLLAALICATTAWAQTKVSSDDELRAAITNDGANITVTADTNLSNSTLKGGWGGDSGGINNEGGDDPTGINVVESGKLKVESSAGAWYDLQGRKIANGQKPTAKGLYINNGKMIVIK